MVHLPPRPGPPSSVQAPPAGATPRQRAAAAASQTGDAYHQRGGPTHAAGGAPFIPPATPDDAAQHQGQRGQAGAPHGDGSARGSGDASLVAGSFKSSYGSLMDASGMAAFLDTTGAGGLLAGESPGTGHALLGGFGVAALRQGEGHGTSFPRSLGMGGDFMMGTSLDVGSPAWSDRMRE